MEKKKDKKKYKDNDDINDNELKQRFQIIENLGKGSFGIVVKALDLQSAKYVAVKLFSKKNLTSQEINELFKESEILSSLNHPGIVRFEQIYETKQHACIVMELVNNGNLKQLLKMRLNEGKPLTDTEVSQIMRAIMYAVQYMHLHDVIHRDLKLENILINDYNDFTSIKIADFGLSAQFGINTSKQLTQKCGTMMYMAPEFARQQQYSKPIDIWSCGIIMYELYSQGKHPFYTHQDDRQSLLKKLCNPRFKYDFQINSLAKDLITKMTSFMASDRYSANQCVKHPWITRQFEDDIPLTFDDQNKYFQKTQQLHYIFQMVLLIKYVQHQNKLSMQSPIRSGRQYKIFENIKPRRHQSCLKKGNTLPYETIPEEEMKVQDDQEIGLNDEEDKKINKENLTNIIRDMVTPNHSQSHHHTRIAKLKNILIKKMNDQQTDTSQQRQQQNNQRYHKYNNNQDISRQSFEHSQNSSEMMFQNDNSRLYNDLYSSKQNDYFGSQQSEMEHQFQSNNKMNEFYLTKQSGFFGNSQKKQEFSSTRYQYSFKIRTSRKSLVDQQIEDQDKDQNRSLSLPKTVEQNILIQKQDIKFNRFKTPIKEISHQQQEILEKIKLREQNGGKFTAPVFQSPISQAKTLDQNIEEKNVQTFLTPENIKFTKKKVFTLPSYLDAEKKRELSNVRNSSNIRDRSFKRDGSNNIKDNYNLNSIQIKDKPKLTSIINENDIKIKKRIIILNKGDTNQIDVNNTNQNNFKQNKLIFLKKKF